LKGHGTRSAHTGWRDVPKFFQVNLGFVIEPKKVDFEADIGVKSLLKYKNTNERRKM
jgi:hypothetical protein